MDDLLPHQELFYDDHFLDSIRYGGKDNDDILLLNDLCDSSSSEEQQNNYVVIEDEEDAEDNQWGVNQQIKIIRTTPPQQQQPNQKHYIITTSSHQNDIIIKQEPITIQDVDMDEEDDNDSSSSSSSGNNNNRRKQQNSSELSLSEEEKRLLQKEGISLPSHYPLTKFEERELKRIRRKIRNKISAQDSRKRKKEFLDKLQQRVSEIEEEKTHLSKKVRTLESANIKLQQQVKRLQMALQQQQQSQQKNKGSVATTTTLLVLILSLALVVVPSSKSGGVSSGGLGEWRSGVAVNNRSYDEEVPFFARSRVITPPTKTFYPSSEYEPKKPRLEMNHVKTKFFASSSTRKKSKYIPGWEGLWLKSVLFDIKKCV